MAEAAPAPVPVCVKIAGTAGSISTFNLLAPAADFTSSVINPAAFSGRMALICVGPANYKPSGVVADRTCVPESVVGKGSDDAAVLADASVAP